MVRQCLTSWRLAQALVATEAKYWCICPETEHGTGVITGFGGCRRENHAPNFELSNSDYDL